MHSGCYIFLLSVLICVVMKIKHIIFAISLLPLRGSCNMGEAKVMVVSGKFSVYEDKFTCL